MNKNIIIIDDDPIYRMIAERLIKKIEPSVVIHHCMNGMTGLESIKSLLDIEEEIIIMLDIHMPVMNGWEVLKSIASDIILDTPNLTLYVVSSSTYESDALEAEKFGFVKQFHFKPLTPSNIKSMLMID